MRAASSIERPSGKRRTLREWLIVALLLFAAGGCKHAHGPDCGALAKVPHATYRASDALGEPSCAMTCDQGWLDCDNAESDGCETSTSGALPHTSIEPGAFTACMTGCQPGFHDCDGDPQNGCESTAACTR
ncbi:MAG TPA: hypothetical protein VH054_11510 [Polyangiaceae bacterium]|nr:hypothetical protein [Polyangiaceae bacterium]